MGARLTAELCMHLSGGEEAPSYRGSPLLGTRSLSHNIGSSRARVRRRLAHHFARRPARGVIRDTRNSSRLASRPGPGNVRTWDVRTLTGSGRVTPSPLGRLAPELCPSPA